MARSNRTDDDATPATPADDTASRLGADKPDIKTQVESNIAAWANPDKGAAPAKGHVLVHCTRKGPFAINMSEPMGGRGLRTMRIELKPGLNLVDPALWSKAAKLNSVTRRRMDGDLIVWAGPAGTDVDQHWAKAKSAVCAAAVQDTADLATLEVLLEIEEREDVIFEVREQIADIRESDTKRSEERQRRRAAHRQEQRRARRFGGRVGTR